MVSRMSKTGATGVDLSQPAIAELCRLRSSANSLPIVPVVGAGLSVPYGLPDWTTFLSQYARLAKCSVAVKRLLASKTPGNFEEAAELIRKKRPRGFPNAIAQQFHVTLEKSVIEQCSAIQELSKLTNGAVLTTNFDNVLECVYANENRCFEAVHLGGLANIPDPAEFPWRRELLKLHGSADVASSIVLTSTEYERHYFNSTSTGEASGPLPNVFAFCSAATVLLFLGCSIESDRYLELLKLYGRKGDVPHYAVLQRPRNDAEELARLDELLTDYNIQPIWIERGKFDQIVELLRHINNTSVEGDESSKTESVYVDVVAPPEGDSLDLRQQFREVLESNTSLVSSTLRMIPVGRLELCNDASKGISIASYPSLTTRTKSTEASVLLRPNFRRLFFTPQGPGGVWIRFLTGEREFILRDEQANIEIIVKVKHE